MNTEEIRRAAAHIESAVNAASNVADRIDDAVQRMAIMLEPGYGGAALKLIELLEQNVSERTESPKGHPILGAEIVAQYPSDPWQPMESAPKDGTVVLALLEGSNIPHPIRWVRFGWRSSWDSYCVPPHEGPLCWMAIPAAPVQPPKGQ